MGRNRSDDSILRNKRRSKGLSQEDIIEQLKNRGITCSQGTISMWEKGEQCPDSIEKLRAIAAIYEINLEKLRSYFSNDKYGLLADMPEIINIVTILVKEGNNKPTTEEVIYLLDAFCKLELPFSEKLAIEIYSSYREQKNLVS